MTAATFPFAALRGFTAGEHCRCHRIPTEKFKTANAKGPHFADPLEMWGEALMRENRSDLALAKFADANKDAPNWGRLHLKWGEALLWSGNGPDAKKQFALAARLDLSAADRAALAEMSAMGSKH